MDIEDYIDILRRHKTWILGPVFCLTVVAVVIAFLWPDTYVSSAIIRVVPPQVPETFVPTNINIEMSQRINSMAQEILSRGNLTNIVNTYNLYPEERLRKPMEDVVEGMRKDVKIGNVVSLTSKRDGVSAFQISFSYEDRFIAQKVTADLVSRFMSENTQQRTQASFMTTQFLKDQVEAARRDLETIEARLAEFRTKFAGRLPDQVHTNQVRLNSLEQRIGNINNAMGRISQEKLMLETDLRAAKNQLEALESMPNAIPVEAQSPALAGMERSIRNLQTQIAALLEHYKENYPDVVRAKAQLSALMKTRDTMLKEEEESATPHVPGSSRAERIYARETAQARAMIARLETAIRSKDLQAEQYSRDITAAEASIEVLQGRIQALPASEQQYAEVVRDRELAKMRYDEMNRKMSQSEVSSDLEKRQQGESLEVLDPASTPQTPTEPKRPLLIAVGTATGLMFGLFLAGFREAKDASLKNLKDVRAYTQLPVLGSIPLLENDLVVRRRRRLGWLAWSTAFLLGIMIMTASVLYYYTTKG
ncbi:MAG: GumC family protein [Bryobacteraceae bacterium]